MLYDPNYIESTYEDHLAEPELKKALNIKGSSERYLGDLLGNEISLFINEYIDGDFKYQTHKIDISKIDLKLDHAFLKKTIYLLHDEDIQEILSYSNDELRERTCFI